MMIKNCLKQNMRTPFANILMILLLSLSGIFMFLSLSIWITAQRSINEARDAFTTVAVLNESEFIQSDVARERGVEKSTYSILEALYKAADASDYVEAIDTRRRCMAYSSGCKATISRDSDGSAIEYPYIYSIIVGTCISIEYEYRGSYVITSKDGSVIEEASYIGYVAVMEIAANESYMADDNYPYKYVRIYSDQFMSDLRDAIVVGERYVLYGQAFYPSTNSGNMTYPEFKLMDLYGTEERYMIYGNDDFSWVKINSNALTKLALSDETKIGKYKITDMYILGYIDYSYLPYARLESTVDYLLETENNSKWANILNEWTVTMHSVQVSLTDDLDSILLFNQDLAYLIDGRVFSEDEYKTGSKVCIISSKYAIYNGLECGDIIDLRFWFNGYKLYNSTTDVYWFSEKYNEKNDFFGDAEYKVIGIYTAKNISVNSEYNIGPNIVFVPSNSMTIQYDVMLPEYTEIQIDKETGSYEIIMKTYISTPNSRSYIIKPGRIRDFEMEMAALGLGGYFYYYDQGYQNIGTVLETLGRNSLILVIISILIWVVIIAVYLILLISRHKNSVRLMILLGAKRSQILAYMIISAIFLVLISSLISGISGCLLYGKVINSAYEEAEDASHDLEYSSLRTNTLSSSDHNVIAVNFSKLEGSPKIIIKITVIQFSLICIFVVLAAFFISSTKCVKCPGILAESDKQNRK
ncbi:MAG: hypothetical protein WCY62_06190 [Clostridia bacterium]